VSSPSVAVSPGSNAATDVPRHRRSLPSAAGTSSAADPALTVKIVPVRAFSGRPPSAGGLKRGSRHDPVQVLVGSIFAFACVSL
jgi:hypothetical protein